MRTNQRSHDVMMSWRHDVMIKASQCHLTVTGDITSLWSVVSVWGESPRWASWEWRLTTRFILTNHVTPPENLNNVAKVLMEADYYTPLFFLFYVFVLSYSTVKCCFCMLEPEHHREVTRAAWVDYITPVRWPGSHGDRKSDQLCCCSWVSSYRRPLVTEEVFIGVRCVGCE